MLINNNNPTNNSSTTMYNEFVYNAFQNLFNLLNATYYLDYQLMGSR